MQWRHDSLIYMVAMSILLINYIIMANRKLLFNASPARIRVNKAKMNKSFQPIANPVMVDTYTKNSNPRNFPIMNNTYAKNSNPRNLPVVYNPQSRRRGVSLLDVIGHADSFLESANPGYKGQLVTVAIDAAGNLMRPRNNNNPGKSPKSNSGTNPVFTDVKRSAGSDASYALSRAPNPKDIKLNSGVKANCYANDYMNPMENICSPLHISCMSMKIPTAVANPLSAHMLNTICFNIQTAAQENVSFGLDIAGAFSASNLVTAFNSAISALQIYFYYSSILSYKSDSENKNAGMSALRANINSEMLSDLEQLGQRLSDTPVPPRVVEWIRYMNGNFLSSKTQGAPIIKIGIDPNSLVNSQSPTFIAQALTSLNAGSNTATFALLRRTIPQWRIGTLYDCHPTPTYDPQFVTIFNNLPNNVRSAGVTIRSNTVTDLITSVPYNSYVNKLDGLAYACSSINIGTEPIPGILSPIGGTVSFPDSRYSYYTVAGVSSFHPVFNYSFLGISRQETFNVIGTTTYTPHLFGTDRVLGSNGNSLLQSAKNSLEFLFYIKRNSNNRLNPSFNKMTS